MVMTTVESNPRGQTIQIGTCRFPAPVSFDDVLLNDLKWIRNYIFHDPWCRLKIDEPSASMRSDAIRVISDDLEHGWVHSEGNVERTLRDDSRDYHPTNGWPHSKLHALLAAAVGQDLVTGEEDGAGPSSATPAVRDDTAPVRRFLDSTGVIRNDEYPMTLWGMKAYARGRMKR